MAHLKFVWESRNKNALSHDELEPLLTPHFFEGHSTSLSNAHLFQKVVAEMLGTFFLLFSVSGISMVGNIVDGRLSLVSQAFATALSIILIISAIGHISGAHVNPAVTISLAACRLFPWSQVPFYVASQLLGACLGTWIAKIIYNVEVGVILTKPSGSNLQAFGMEVLISFHLMFLVAAVASECVSTRELNAFSVGGAVALNMILGAPISGASMNPARSLGPALISGYYKGIWIYLVAPPIGGSFGAVVFRILRTTVHTASSYQSLSFVSTQ